MLILNFEFVHISQANNKVIRSWGEKRLEPKLKNHVDLVELLGIADLKKGIKETTFVQSLKALWFLMLNIL
jgi:seryl-tRNA synthetase